MFDSCGWRGCAVMCERDLPEPGNLSVSTQVPISQRKPANRQVMACLKNSGELSKNSA
jgi:hypothetical protein